jgi:hypothetical protein
MQQAVQSGDQAAVKTCRREFKRVASKWKRHYEEQAQEQMWHYLLSNPRKFWSTFQGSKASVLGADMSELQGYWSELYGGAGRGSLPETAGSMEELLADLEAVARTSHWYQQGERLNAEFTRAEILAALKKLHNGRAPGPDCLRSEFFKYASITRVVGDQKIESNVLAPVLQALYESLFSQGKYVEEWSAATLSAVFKKGDATCLDNYRAIAVGGVLGKLFAVLLETRLTVAAEKHGWRAEGQAGFRPNKSTVDQVFTLRHIIEYAQLGPSSAPLYCCFVDFKKAYDRVRRDRLMNRLAELGIHAEMLRAIVQMYWSVPLTPKLGKELGAPIDSTCGVKQGDPMSPLLFGLFIDELEGWMEERLGDRAGVLLGAMRLYMLLYADDLVLMSRSKAGLQRQLDVLAQFCEAKGMEMNLSKTEAVVFRPRGQEYRPEWQWQYMGQPVPVSQEFRYLGIIFHETEGVFVAENALCTAARRAMWAMLGRFRVAGIRDMSMKLRLYRAIVAPIMEYCSAVWAPALMQGCSSWDKACKSSMQQVQNVFLRQLGQLRASTPVAILHRECCMEPVSSLWLRSMVQLWGRLRSAPARSVLGRAARSALKLAQRGRPSVRKACWAGQFMAMLGCIARASNNGTGVEQFVYRWGWSAAATGWVVDTEESLLPLPEISLRGAWDDLLRKPWQALAANPRESSSSVKFSTYNGWFALPLPVQIGMADEPVEGSGFPRHPSNLPGYIQSSRGIPYEHVKNLMRLRTGAHHLMIETGRWHKMDVGQGTLRAPSREHRVCTKCRSYTVEDELHLLFECPAYHSIRVQYAAALFGGLGGVSRCASEGAGNPGLLCQFMQQDPRLVAAFVSECMTCQRYFAPDVDLWTEDVSVDSQVLWLSLLAVCIYLLYQVLFGDCPWGWLTPEGDGAASSGPLSPGRSFDGANL